MHQHRNFAETASDEANFRMLEAGRVDYVVLSFVQGMRLIGSMGLYGKVEPLLSRSLKEDDMYVIFSKELVSPAFVDAFSHVASIQADRGVPRDIPQVLSRNSL